MITKADILEIRRGAEVKEYPLTKQSTTIGRLSKNDVVLINDGTVSRDHARLDRKGNALYVTDIKSANGTMLNNRKLEPQVPYQVNDSDVISIGTFILTYHLDRAISSRTEIAGSRSTAGQMSHIVRSGWFIGIISALVLIGIAALVWYFAPLLFPSPIIGAKPTVVLIQTSDSFGSGVIINKEGYVLTCNRILKADSPIQVTVLDSAQFEGKVVTRDEKKDLAIIKINTGSFNIPVASLGDSDKLLVGDELIAIGYPLGLKGGATVSKGIFSALRESNQTRYIQTDVPYSLGNAGSPVINSRGEVVGIMITGIQRENVQGITLAITINEVKPFVSMYK